MLLENVFCSDKMEILELVSKGIKPASSLLIFEDSKTINKIKETLEKKYPNMDFILNDIDSRMMEFCNKKNIEKIFIEKYPSFINVSYKDVFYKIKKFKLEDKWRFLGTIYGYPDICIEEFVKNIEDKKRQFMSLNKDLNIYYKSEEARIEAESYINYLRNNLKK